MDSFKMNSKLATMFCLVTLIGQGSQLLFSDETKPKTNPVKKLILPGESFLLEGRPAFVLLPPMEKRQNPQPWIMYAPTLPAYPDNHEKWMHEQFLQAGVAVAGIDAGESYGSPKGQKLMSALYEELTTKRRFSKKPCLRGCLICTDVYTRAWGRPYAFCEALRFEGRARQRGITVCRQAAGVRRPKRKFRRSGSLFGSRA